MPIWLHSILCKILVRPAVWAMTRPKQNFVTRSFRAAWRAL